MTVVWEYFEESFVDGLTIGYEIIRVNDNYKCWGLGSWRNRKASLGMGRLQEEQVCKSILDKFSLTPIIFPNGYVK